MMEESAFLVWYTRVLVFVIGACVGSFLNVVIYRLPAGKSVVRPRSQCRCGAAIAWYDNIPVLSWFLLGGRSRCCGERFSFRYPMVELGTALVFVGLWEGHGWPTGGVWVIFAAALIAAAFIDFDTMEIPDRFTVGGFLVGLVASALLPSLHGGAGSGYPVIDAIRGLREGLLGAFVGSGLILWIALSAEAILRKEAMGFGDVKLMGAIGAFCGWQGAVFAFFGGAVLGCLLLVVIIPLQRFRKTEEGTRVPFGPALAGGALLYLLWAEPHVSAYFANISGVLESL